MGKQTTIIYYTYNQKEKIKITIDSIRKQRYSDWELVIIDDASTDDTKEEIRRVLEMKEEKHIRVICNDTFRGREKSINDCVKKVKGKYLTFIEDGVVWTPYKLAVQIQKMEDYEKSYPRKKVGLCYGYVKLAEDAYMPERKITIEVLCGKIAPILLIKELIDFNAVVIKRDVWLMLGGLEEQLVANSEREFFVRLSLDYDILFEDMVLADKEQHVVEENGKKQVSTIYYILEQYLEYYKVFGKLEATLKQIFKLCLAYGGYSDYGQLLTRLEEGERVDRTVKEEKALIKIEEIRYHTSKYIAEIITELKYITILINEKKWLVAENRYTKVGTKISCLSIMLECLGEVTIELSDDIKKIEEYSDIIVSGDLVTRNIIPKLEQCASLFYPPVLEDDVYSIEPTSSGYYTIKTNNQYLHGNDNPMFQAYYVAKYYFDVERREYNIFGAGLGYVCYQLYHISNYTAKINLYEPDENVIQFGYDYGVFGDIPTENFQVTYDPTGEKFLTKILNNTDGSIMDQRTVNRMEESVDKDALIMVTIQYNTDRNLGDSIAINRTVLREQSSYDYDIDDFFAHVDQKEMIIIAAGPTLDFSLEWIREQQGKKTIIAVTTVAKKLLEADITPDYLAVLDPQERTYGHMKGIENITIPMIIGYGAYWKFATNYKGKRYLAKYKDSARGYMYTGQTVTNLAIQLAIEAKATKIYLAGVDLAFVGGMSHASGTMDLKKEAKEGPIMVEAVGGGQVATSQAFKLYISQVEQQVANAPDITFINLSKGGARIKGTQEGL